MNKQIKKINIVFAVSVAVITGLIVLSIIRNIPYGTGAMLTIGIIQTTMLALIILAYLIKFRILAILSRLVVVSWSIITVINSLSSTNEDAMIWASLYVIAEVTAIVCGILRRKVLSKND